MPHLKPYQGVTDPVKMFQDLMLVLGVPDELMCKLFPTTLSRPVKIWFKNLPFGSVRDFANFATDFLCYFQSAKPPSKDPTTLQYIKQSGKNLLRDFVKRYSEVESLGNFWHNLYIGSFWFSFGEAYNIAIRQITIKERGNIKQSVKR